MKHYEFVFLTRLGVSKKELDSKLKKIGELFKKAGAKIRDQKDWGKKKLVYPIKKENEAQFWLWHLIFDDQVDLSEIQTFLAREKGVIRYLLLKKRGKESKMATRSLNKVMLIGNLTRDPELRYTPKGTAVCNFGLATNRSWTSSEGEDQESAQFHRIVAWTHLAELCAKLLSIGDKVYLEGRVQYREWTGDDNVKRKTTEIVIDQMILLNSRNNKPLSDSQIADDSDNNEENDLVEEFEKMKKEETDQKETKEKGKKEKDIPF